MDIGEANTGSCKLIMLLIEVQKAFCLKLNLSGNLSGKSLLLSQALKQNVLRMFKKLQEG